MGTFHHSSQPMESDSLSRTRVYMNSMPACHPEKRSARSLSIFAGYNILFMSSCPPVIRTERALPRRAHHGTGERGRVFRGAVNLEGHGTNQGGLHYDYSPGKRGGRGEVGLEGRTGEEWLNLA